MEKTYLIPESVLMAVGAYLIERPYKEVAHLVPALEKLPQLTPQAQEAKQDSKPSPAKRKAPTVNE